MKAKELAARLARLDAAELEIDTALACGEPITPAMHREVISAMFHLPPCEQRKILHASALLDWMGAP